MKREVIFKELVKMLTWKFLKERRIKDASSGPAKGVRLNLYRLKFITLNERENYRSSPFTKQNLAFMCKSANFIMNNIKIVSNHSEM